MMTAQQLKNSILQRAIEGKLVEQRLEEGTAKELLKQIKLEKDKLIKEGKIKKAKLLPPITEDEIPFDIPDSWEWVRLGDIAIFENGDRSKKYPTEKDFCTDGIPFLGAKDMVDGNISLQNVRFITKEKYDELGQGKLKDKDIVCLLRGSVGKMAIFKETTKYKTGFICAQMLILRFVLLDIIDTYFTLLNAPYIQTAINSKVTGTAVRQLPAKELKDLIVPLIPLAEQHRIVAKIEEMLPLVDQYDKAYSKLTDLNEKFPQDMKKSILQYAIEGKLVEQLPEEGTAADLLKEIKAEKAKLLKEGKIKKTKPLPPITEDEIPFDIPDSWEWVRLENITSVVGDGIHGTPEYDDNGEKYFVNGNNLCNGKIILKDNTKRVSSSEAEKYSVPLNGKTVLVSINGTIGNIAFYNDEPIILGKSACYFNLLGDIDKKYIKSIIESSFFMEYALQIATGSTIKNVSLKAMRNCIIPLPPLSEQHRIVERLDQLLPLCNKLMKKM